jgi:hypothetical protein
MFFLSVGLLGLYFGCPIFGGIFTVLGLLGLVAESHNARGGQ